MPGASAPRKNKGGRPRIAIDYELLGRLAALQCTDVEIAANLMPPISVDTVTRRKQEDADFAEAYTRGKEQGKTSLRRAQWKVALEGNPRMLEWLGKQYLGQIDRRTTELTGDAERPISTGLDNLLRRLVPEFTTGGASEAS